MAWPHGPAVGSLQSRLFGLYDMHGNFLEEGLSVEPTMFEDVTNRREFLGSAAAGAAVAWWTLSGAAEASVAAGSLHIACNQYPWGTFYGREGRTFGADLPASLREVADSGMQGYEPLLESPAAVEQLAPVLQANQLAMRSLYVNSTLHEAGQVADSSQRVLEIAQKAQVLLGTRIIVTNPSPIRWGGPENKSDEQLRVQAAALDRLGADLAALGLTLAYHNHDIELRQAAREFHHMLAGTDPQHVTFCLDAHWVFRGAGNSCVALADAVTLYGKRVTELHLRQSKDGIWTEVFADGDIDYRELAKRLLDLGVKPHLVLEQAVEQGSPQTLSAVEAHRRSRQYAAEVFAGFAGSTE